ncbi:PG2IP-like protein [Mya arenaria]|uniref:PG2IP-like protein n=1 Tax=Mya arenaria TaxID=6604 RepID=A0ABY7DRB3_MYAAR|nr:PG2IP-like protein [Mya arenaria]
MAINDNIEECPTFRMLLRDTIHSYVFWCLFQGLAPMIWFYPLNELEISGYEVYAGLWFIHIITGISFIKRLVDHWFVYAFLRGLCVLALASFQAPSTLERLIDFNMLGFIAGVSCFCCLTCVVCDLRADLVVKHYKLCRYLCRSHSSLPSPSQSPTKKPLERGPWLTTGLGFGSLLYLINWVFGEVSLVTRWTVKGYPDIGPEPFPWGRSVAGCVRPVCVAGDGRPGITMSACPYALPCSPHNFFLVWCTAYNFVPLGEYTREHTDILVGINMVFIFLGLFAVLAVILCAGLLGFGNRYNDLRGKFDRPVQSSPKQITTAIWTYHFGYDNKGWPSLERTASLLNDTGADVITMLESDASKPFLGNNDLGTWLGERLGLNLILSKYPFVKSAHHLLPSPHGELAPAVTATVNVSGSLVDFVVTHMGNDRDKLDRKLQAEFLARELKQSKEYNELINQGNMKDIDTTDKKRFCEYIMYRGLIRQGYARITHGGLSDTELQMARFEIPETDDYHDNTKVTTDTVKHAFPPHVLFNSKFGELHHGHGYFNTHRFHMSTPKYFLP